MIPADPGSYVLVLDMKNARRVRIGRLGMIKFPAGHYLYVGSAWGPGGLRARIAHHMRRATKPHWHIDYLRRVCRVDSVWYETAQHAECLWADELKRCSTATPVIGFGCSDCRCRSHLFHVNQPEHGEVIPSMFGTAVVKHG